MEFERDDDRARLDREAIRAFLSTEAYWGRWRTRDQLGRQIDSAWRVVGAYESPTGRLIGFARAFSDEVASAYLADVFALSGARGHGVGKALVRTMVDEGPGRDSGGCCTPATPTGSAGVSVSPPRTAPSWSDRPGSSDPRSARPAADGRAWR